MVGRLGYPWYSLQFAPRWPVLTRTVSARLSLLIVNRRSNQIIGPFLMAKEAARFRVDAWHQTVEWDWNQAYAGHGNSEDCQMQGCKPERDLHWRKNHGSNRQCWRRKGESDLSEENETQPPWRWIRRTGRTDRTDRREGENRIPRVHRITILWKQPQASIPPTLFSLQLPSLQSISSSFIFLFSLFSLFLLPFFFSIHLCKCFLLDFFLFSLPPPTLLAGHSFILLTPSTI